MKKQIGQEDPSHQNLGILRRLGAEVRAKVPQSIQDLVRDGYVSEIDHDDSSVGRYFNFYAPDYDSYLCMRLGKRREYWIRIGEVEYDGDVRYIVKMFRAYVDGDEAAMWRFAAKLEQR